MSTWINGKYYSLLGFVGCDFVDLGDWWGIFILVDEKSVALIVGQHVF